MKKEFFLLIIGLLPIITLAQSQKDKERWAYVSTQLKLSKETKAKVQPIFYNYMKDLHAAKDIYDNVKDKYITSIRKKTLTANQANQLNNAHWTSDNKVVEVRKSYTQKFATVLTAQQVYYLFSYANDSKSKRQGKK